MEIISTVLASIAIALSLYGLVKTTRSHSCAAPSKEQAAPRIRPLTISRHRIECTCGFDDATLCPGNQPELKTCTCIPNQDPNQFQKATPGCPWHDRRIDLTGTPP